MTSYTLGHIATYISAELHGDSATEIEGIATLEHASSRQLSFLANPQYVKFLPHTRAGAVIIAPQFRTRCSTNLLVMNNPYAGYAKASALYAPSGVAAGIASTACVSSAASIGEGVAIGPQVVIEGGAVIGAHSVIGAGCYIGRQSRLGEANILHPSVTLYHGVSLGNRVRIHSGAVIGSDGFGFAPDQGKWLKIEQLGGVRIGSDVEIGANTTIDRGALDDTVIEDHVCLDNQIQIAHNVHIGEGTVIAACTGISGSSVIGRRCMLGGGVGIAGHLNITDGVQITGMTLVTHDIREPGIYSSGTAVEPNRSWRKNVARFRQLDKLARRIKKLESSAPDDD